MAISECHVNYVHYVRVIMYLNRATSMAILRHGCVTNAIRMRYEATFSTRNYLDIYASVDIILLTHMRSKASKPSRVVEGKAEALRRQGALHPHPEAVRDEAFRQGEFFDPRDLVQVHYEMLRRRQVDGQAVTEVAAAFGVSRQAFYTTEAAFEDMGLCGLLPRQRGPRRAHKCTDEILDFVEQWRADSAAEKDVTGAIQKHFGVSIHLRSIERALTRRKKKR
jgi:transposase